MKKAAAIVVFIWLGLPAVLVICPLLPDTFGALPNPGATSSDPQQLDVLAGAWILEVESGPADADGTFHRTRLVRVDHKYPLLAVEEKVGRDLQTGADVVQEAGALESGTIGTGGFIRLRTSR